MPIQDATYQREGKGGAARTSIVRRKQYVYVLEYRKKEKGAARHIVLYRVLTP